MTRLTATQRELLADIERIIVENAQVLGQEPELGVRRQPNSAIRIQSRIKGRWIRGAHTDYPTIEIAHRAAVEANRRARVVGEKMAKGETFAAALEATPVNPDWRAAA